MDYATLKLIHVASAFVNVALGSIALRRGRTRATRALAFVLALCVALYIVSAAVTRSPLGPLAALI